MRSPRCLCIVPLTTFECLNLSSQNFVCTTWHLNPSQWGTLQIPPTSLCICMCIPLTIARQQLTKHVPTAISTCNNNRWSSFSVWSMSYEGKVANVWPHTRKNHFRLCIMRTSGSRGTQTGSSDGICMQGYPGDADCWVKWIHGGFCGRAMNMQKGKTLQCNFGLWKSQDPK